MTNQLRAFFWFVLSLFSLTLVQCQPATAAIIYEQDFETYIPGDLILTDDTAPTNPDVSTEQAFGGSYSMKSVVAAFNGSTPNGYRAEFNGFDVGGDQYLEYDTTYWVSFAIYVPANYHNSKYGDIVWQMHNSPNDGVSWTNPTAQMNIQNRTWEVQRGSKYAGPPVRLGAWTPVVMQFRLSTDSTGFYKVWIDGQQVVNITGANSLNESTGSTGYRPFMKMGAYVWVRKKPTASTYPGDSTAEVTLYHDNIKIGDAAETYDSMFPVSGGSGAGEETTKEYITSFSWLSQCVNGTSVIAGTNFDGSYFPCPSGWTVKDTSVTGFGTSPTLNKNGGTNEERWAAITNDTTGTGNVLEMGIAATNVSEGKGRVQFGANINSFRTVKWRYKALLNADHNLLKTYPSTFTWFTLSSAYSDNTWNSAYPFVMSSDIEKQASGTVANLYLRARGRPYDATTYTPLSATWTQTQNTVPVPIGQWFTLEHEIYDGDAGSGDYKIYITPNGGSRTLVLDVNNTTRHPSKTATNGVTAITPLKYYMGSDVINHVVAGGGKLVMQVDDLQMLGCQDVVGCDWPTLETSGGGGGGGTPPVTGPAITRINTNDTIEPGTALNTFDAQELSGAFAGTVGDGVDSESVQVLGFPNGIQGAFSTGGMTNIGTPATVSIQYATPMIYNVNPRAPWPDNFSSGGTYSNNATAYGPFVNGRTLTTTGTNWIRSTLEIGSVTSGDVVDVQFFYAAGTGNKGLFGCSVGAPGATVRGTIGSLGVGTTTLGTPTFTDTASTIYPGLRVVDMRVTVNATGTMDCGMGPYSSVNGDSIHEYGIRAWKNRAPVSVTRQVTIPSLAPPVAPAPTISSITTLTSGQTFTVSGTGLRSVVRAYIENEEQIVAVTDFAPNADGTSITATAPFGLTEGGNMLVLEWSPHSAINTNAVAWGDNSGGALILQPYTGTNWVTTQGATIVGTSIGYHRTTQDMIELNQGEQAFARFYWGTGSSGKLEAVVSSPSSRKIIVEGTSEVMNMRVSDTGSSHTAPVLYTSNGVNVLEVSWVANESGLYKMGMGTDSDIDQQTVIGFGKQMWTATELGIVNSPVTVASATTKKIKFTTQVLRRAGTAFTGTVERLAVWHQNPLTTLRQNEIFTAEAVQFIGGNFATGQYTGAEVNQLQPGVTYYLSAADSDSDPYWVVPFQIVVE